MANVSSSQYDCITKTKQQLERSIKSVPSLNLIKRKYYYCNTEHLKREISLLSERLFQIHIQKFVKQKFDVYQYFLRNLEMIVYGKNCLDFSNISEAIFKLINKVQQNGIRDTKEKNEMVSKIKELVEEIKQLEDENDKLMATNEQAMRDEIFFNTTNEDDVPNIEDETLEEMVDETIDEQEDFKRCSELIEQFVKNRNIVIRISDVGVDIPEKVSLTTISQTINLEQLTNLNARNSKPEDIIKKKNIIVRISEKGIEIPEEQLIDSIKIEEESLEVGNKSERKYSVDDKCLAKDKNIDENKADDTVESVCHTLMIKEVSVNTNGLISLSDEEISVKSEDLDRIVENFDNYENEKVIIGQSLKTPIT